MITLAIALGGPLGSVARYWLSTIFDSRLGAGFPWGTFWVNVTGCVVIGFAASLTLPDGRAWGSVESRQFLITGFCGGYTTFSTFSLQTLTLLKEGDWIQAFAYILGSVVLCLFGIWLGQTAATLVNQTSAG